MKSPLIVHIVHRFDFGGLENGLVNLINRLTDFRHIVIALTEATEITQRIDRDDVRVHALHKRPGFDLDCYRRLYELLRELAPNVVHTRNFGTLDCQIVAWLAGVTTRIHGEHGWDTHDPAGQRLKHRWIRRAVSLLVHRFVALSSELEHWLVQTVGISHRKVVRICNGVDLNRFAAAIVPRYDAAIVGSVTRFSEIKDPMNTIRAFESLASRHPAARLVMVGDGPLLEDARKHVNAAGHTTRVCFAGAVLDVAPQLAHMSVFVLGSRREGISNTILEAMAAALPVVATDVGGNRELIEEGVTGSLVPAESTNDLAAAIERYLHDPELAARHGAAGRRRVEMHFSLDGMVHQYAALYGVALA